MKVCITYLRAYIPKIDNTSKILGNGHAKMSEILQNQKNIIRNFSWC